RDVASGLAERRLVLLRRRGGGLVVAAAGLAQRLHQQRVDAAVGRAHVRAGERLAGAVVGLGERLGRRRLLLRGLGRLELRQAGLLGLAERAERLADGAGVGLVRPDRER